MDLNRVFVGDRSRARDAHTQIWLAGQAAEGAYEITLKPVKSVKSREQEEKYHALIGEIAKVHTVYGKKLPAESWKRLLIDAFKHETRNDPELGPEWAKFGTVEMLPALNHPGFVMVGEQSRRFSVKLAGGFIEWLEAFKATSEVEAAA